MPQSNDDVASLAELLQTRNDVDVWKAPSLAGREVHVHLRPDVIEDFKARLDERSLAEIAIITDSQESIDNQSMCCGNDKGLHDFDNCYNTLEEIHRELYRLANAHPSLAKVVDLGKSHEERDMLGMTIKRNASNTQGLIFITCGIHAREWISPATCMYLMRQLLNSTGNDQEIADMLKTFEWFFLSVLNVDGYDFTHKEDRLWRKNRRVLNSSCIGVDLNRNFYSVQWGTGKCSKDLCCEVYPGDRPFSEKESSNVANYLAKRSSELVAFFDIHSYSQMWLSPWGWKDDMPTEYSQMETLMSAAADAIYNTSGKQYYYGPTFSTIYPTYGDTVDYVYDKLNVVHSYGLELRPGDDDPNGFLLSACEIIPTGREIMAALKAITPILTKEKETVVEKNRKEEKRREEKRREEKRREEKRREEKRREEKRREEKRREKKRRETENIARQ
ncbi:carboxypeptidase B-like [Oculina patagonica]